MPGVDSLGQVVAGRPKTSTCSLSTGQRLRLRAKGDPAQTRLLLDHFQPKDLQARIWNKARPRSLVALQMEGSQVCPGPRLVQSEPALSSVWRSL